MDPLFLAALFAGGSHTLAAWAQPGGPWVIAWKGAGVALLALWVQRRASGGDGRAMVAVLACGALGDVLLAISFQAGAAAFLVGHIIAAWIYNRHRQGPIWAAPFAAIVVALMGYALTTSLAVAFYAATLGLMAGSAAASVLPRSVAVGALLFVSSDLLIFARLDPLADSMVPTILVWPLYFTGQALIARGAVRAFGRSQPAA